MLLRELLASSRQMSLDVNDTGSFHTQKQLEAFFEPVSQSGPRFRFNN
jgi:hypothetical protein